MHDGDLRRGHAERRRRGGDGAQPQASIVTSVEPPALVRASRSMAAPAPGRRPCDRTYHLDRHPAVAIANASSAVATIYSRRSARSRSP